MLTNFKIPQTGNVSPSDYCSDLDLQRSLLIKHKIDDYGIRKALFFGNDLIADMSINVSDLNAYLQNKICGFHNAVLEVNFENGMDNSEIKLLNPQPAQGPNPPIQAFSLTFFRAIINYWGQAHYINVSKAISDQGDYKGRSLVFKVIDINANILYCADLSGVYP
jgi:hypothetical protein